jgi:hypothetical protein
MDDRRPYAAILGIAAPWDVVRVELDDAAKAVHVWPEARPETSFCCPESQALAPGYDHVERRWRHLELRARTRRASTLACHAWIARRTG